MDVELSAPAVNETLESWQVSTRDAGTLLRGGSMCKVAGSINSTGCDSVCFSLSEFAFYPTSV